MNGYQVRQIRISEAMYQTLKAYCHSKNMTMTECYDKILHGFIRKLNRPVPANIDYLAGIKNGKLLSMWIREEYIKIISTLALNANVSEARVIYTALMKYFEVR